MPAAAGRTLGVGLLTLTVGLGLAACSSSGGGQEGGAEGSDAASHATITVTADGGCEIDRDTLAAGGITFDVKNVDATAVSEVEVLDGQRIIGEKENLPPGVGGTFSVTADAGDYTLYCPGASTERRTITVTGEAAGVQNESIAALLQQAADGYSKYVTTQVGYLVDGVKTLDEALHGTDLHAAQVAYAEARPFYEKIEPVAESFSVGDVNLDLNIDARANDVPPDEFRGFHRIEKGLFEDQSLDGLGDYGDRLVDDVERLQKLTDGQTYQPTELANGAQALLDEVAATKITGEEERYSHLDVLDIANNVEGSQQAFAQLTPAMEKLDPQLTGTIQDRFSALTDIIDTYRAPGELGGYVRYSDLTAQDKHDLAAAVKAVQEPLSKVAAKVAQA